MTTLQYMQELEDEERLEQQQELQEVESLEYELEAGWDEEEAENRLWGLRNGLVRLND